MEALQEEEEFNHCGMMIMKGKRTKRPRQSSATSTSSTTSGEISSEEDQDMANCLILLAQGIRSPPENRVCEQGDLDSERKKDQKLVNNNNNNSTSNSDSYECKTCNRAFQSFQALGGHRASHKKPKITSTTTQEKKQTSPAVIDYDDHKNKKLVDEIKEEKEIELKVRLISKISCNTQSNKVHECSICGAEFSSGQALGGHMRRHRSPPALSLSLQPPATTTTAANGGKLISYDINDHDQKKKKKKNLLQLDLNLPAPLEVEDDKFQYISPKMVFSGPTLVVGCHY